MTLRPSPQFSVAIAQGAADLRAAQRLRYEVFVAELGGDGPLVDHTARLEKDAFDPHATHLILRDLARPDADQVVGVYRLLDAEAAQAAGQFYCATEFDLAPLTRSGLKLLELGRSCLHRDYRGGIAMMHLWQALADHVQAQGIDVLFGVASFHGTDLERLAAPLSLLFHRHAAPPPFQVQATGLGARAFAPLPLDRIDRVAAMRDTPALIKAYLRIGGVVGQGVYVDEAFNTTDVCLILPTSCVSLRQKQIYSRPLAHG
ncbi:MULTISPECIES: GNAT family N-acetyltransferase [unclassified Yoonia]|uniref:GNAT family N-acetyltransferase n=1 Tax=unclassified Yoonia TaxID=2629118 RepID=UPI002AFF9357|nr:MULTISPECIES: GNAT family N-acyltransferase [unclassified Yoonia]